MYSQGWVRVWRQMEDWEWYKVPNMVHLFQHLILKANHQENRWQGISVKRGQLVTSLQSLKEQTGISIQSIRTCLKKLKLTGEIVEKTTSSYRLITICKYDTYQSDQQTSNNQVTNNQQAANKQLTTNKNDKNVNNEKNKEYMSIFDEARKLFKGTKRGNKTEYDNFVKKHTDWKDVLPLLMPAVSQQIIWRAADGVYWKHFKTWINNRCWEETQGVKTESKEKQRLYPIKGKVCSVKGCRMPAVYLDASGNYDSYKCGEHLPEKVKEKYS